MAEHELTSIDVRARSGPHEGYSAVFDKSPVFIGRAPTNDISLTRDSTVSGIHAVLHWEKGCWWLKDCGSSNGTFLCDENGRSLVRKVTALSTGQDVFVGSTRLSLDFDVGDQDITVYAPSGGAEAVRACSGLELSISCQEGSLLCRLASLLPTVATYSRAYDDTILDEIDRRLDELVSLTNVSADSAPAMIHDSLPERMRRLGGAVSERLLPQKIVEKMSAAQGDSLFLSLHPELIRVPWELAVTNDEPWCLRFDMGRQIMLDEVSVRVSPRSTSKPLSILIVADPRDDLPESRVASEKLLQSILDDHPGIDVNLVAGSRVTRENLLDRLEETDILYYNGHAEHDLENPSNSAWLLKDGRVTCQHFGSLKSPPSLVFANACESGKESAWAEPRLHLDDLTGMVSSFLAAGVTHYLGATWPIGPEGGSAFADAFFSRLLRGAPVGASVRLARHDLKGGTGPDSLIWASYVLYGDPTHKFV